MKSEKTVLLSGELSLNEVDIDSEICVLFPLQPLNKAIKDTDTAKIEKTRFIFSSAKKLSNAAKYSFENFAASSFFQCAAIVCNFLCINI